PELNPTGYYPNPHWKDISLTPASTFWQVPAFRMNVRSVNLGYTLPDRLTQAAKISNARLFLSAMNPLTLYNPFDYRDATAAYDVYPNLRTYSLGVNVTFYRFCCMKTIFKKYNTILLSVVGLSLLVGCKTDFLEEKRNLTGMNVQVFENESTATAYID